VPATQLDRGRADISRLGRPDAGPPGRVGTAGIGRVRIGLDYNSYCMPLARFARMRDALPAAQFVDLGDVVWQLRLIKSPAEIALLGKAAAIADEALRHAAAVCRAGTNQREAARIAVDAFVALGADPGPPGPITAGRGWDFLHSHLEDAALTDGDIVHIELTPRIAGYSARTMRCVAVGTPAPGLLDAGKRLAEIQDRQIAAMRPGAVAREVDAILRDGVLRVGLRDSYDNITGYTLGCMPPPDRARVISLGSFTPRPIGQSSRAWCSICTPRRRRVAQ